MTSQREKIKKRAGPRQGWDLGTSKMLRLTEKPAEENKDQPMKQGRKEGWATVSNTFERWSGVMMEKQLLNRAGRSSQDGFQGHGWHSSPMGVGWEERRSRPSREQVQTINEEGQRNGTAVGGALVQEKFSEKPIFCNISTWFAVNLPWAQDIICF